MALIALTCAYDLGELDALLAAGGCVGRVHFQELTGSTNNDAMAAIERGKAQHGSVFLADAQSAGRGRSNHRWHSAQGQGIYVSVVLIPEVATDRLLLLPLAAGLAASEAVEAATGLSVDLRWPNDLLAGERKVGGILVETRGAFAVVGVGINVHQREFGDELATPATSVDVALGHTTSRHEILTELLSSLMRELMNLRDEDAAAELLQRLEARSSWLTGRKVRVHGPQACQGVTAGLDAQGFLRVRTTEGVVTVRTGGLRAD